MNILLDFLPITLSSVAGILAVWGDCTIQGRRGIFKRLRPRGHLIVTSLLIALLLSFGKQAYDSRQERQKEMQIIKVSSGVEKVSTDVGGVSSGVREVGTKVDTVAKRVDEIRDLVKLGALIGLSQAKGELTIKPGDILDDKALYREVRGERVYDMEKVLSEIERLKKSTGFDQQHPASLDHP